MRELGLKDLGVDELVSLSDYHVTPHFVREMRREQGDDLSIAQLHE